MLDNEMPGAALEAADTFTLLAVPFWPRLPLALGYTGGARWVAFYLALDKVTYSDGASSGTGETSLFLAFKRHPVVAPHLAGAHLGSADEEAKDWLVVDRQEQMLYLATQEEARWHLLAQWPRYHRPPLEHTRVSWDACWTTRRKRRPRPIGQPSWPRRCARAGPTRG